jgi:hypothetical protein
MSVLDIALGLSLPLGGVALYVTFRFSRKRRLRKVASEKSQRELFPKGTKTRHDRF